MKTSRGTSFGCDCRYGPPRLFSVRHDRGSAYPRTSPALGDKRVSDQRPDASAATAGCSTGRTPASRRRLPPRAARPRLCCRHMRVPEAGLFEFPPAPDWLGLICPARPLCLHANTRANHALRSDQSRSQRVVRTAELLRASPTDRRDRIRTNPKARCGPRAAGSARSQCRRSDGGAGPS
jgi:hypothetical protein